MQLNLLHLLVLPLRLTHPLLLRGPLALYTLFTATITFAILQQNTDRLCDPLSDDLCCAEKVTRLSSSRQSSLGSPPAIELLFTI